MRAGELNKQITLQKPTPTVNGYNEEAPGWTDVATVWAAIDWQSGRRYEAAKQLNAEVQGVIRIRYRSDVKPEWRLKYGSRYFEIITISNVKERNAELQLNCKDFQD